MEVNWEQVERAQDAAEKRTQDPLRNWRRPEREECKICFLPLPPDPEDTIHHSC